MRLLSRMKQLVARLAGISGSCSAPVGARHGHCPACPACRACLSPSGVRAPDRPGSSCSRIGSCPLLLVGPLGPRGTCGFRLPLAPGGPGWPCSSAWPSRSGVRCPPTTPEREGSRTSRASSSTPSPGPVRNGGTPSGGVFARTEGPLPRALLRRGTPGGCLFREADPLPPVIRSDEGSFPGWLRPGLGHPAAVLPAAGRAARTGVLVCPFKHRAAEPVGG